jgi:glucan phosphoethanolaminetransferase (alkaline phosphatase superfamily)
MFTKMYLLIIILALISLFICIQEENKQEEMIREPYINHFVNHLVLPPLVAGRIRPFYRNNRKFYTELYEKYTGMATKHMRKNGLV